MVAHLCCRVKMRSIASSFQLSGMLVTDEDRSSLALDPLPFAFDVNRHDALRHVCVAVLVGPFAIARPALQTDQTDNLGRQGHGALAGRVWPAFGANAVQTARDDVRDWLNKTSEIYPSGCREQIFYVSTRSSGERLEMTFEGFELGSTTPCFCDF